MCDQLITMAWMMPWLYLVTLEARPGLDMGMAGLGRPLGAALGGRGRPSILRAVARIADRRGPAHGEADIETGSFPYQACVVS